MTHRQHDTAAVVRATVETIRELERIDSWTKRSMLEIYLATLPTREMPNVDKDRLESAIKTRLSERTPELRLGCGCPPGYRSSKPHCQNCGTHHNPPCHIDPADIKGRCVDCGLSFILIGTSRRCIRCGGVVKDAVISLAEAAERLREAG